MIPRFFALFMSRSQAGKDKDGQTQGSRNIGKGGWLGWGLGGLGMGMGDMGWNWDQVSVQNFTVSGK